ncbi:glycerate kinase, partial [Streptomyces cavourensis]|nr:glycerate kinase [Streptomyces cavourensis]
METARVLVAADKFKGSLTAVQVAERVTAGLRRVVPGLEVETLPVADGGDGLLPARHGRRQGIHLGRHQ